MIVLTSQHHMFTFYYRPHKHCVCPLPCQNQCWSCIGAIVFVIILILEAVIAIHIIKEVFNSTKKVDAKNDTGVNHQKKQEVVLNKLWK